MRGAKVGLLITKGYRAVQEIQNQARDGNLFDYFYAKPPPIAPQSLTREIPERSDYAGNVLAAARPTTRCAQAARELKAAGVESIAVCYLFSFMNPGARGAKRARSSSEEFPGVQVSLSSEVLPRIREWPRLSTTLLNAYLEPVMVRYIDHLNGGLDDAGVAHAAALPDAVERRRDAVLRGDRRRPHRAHAVLRPRRRRAGERLSRRARTRARGLVTLDMGGTSADIAFIEGGAPLEVTEGVIARRQIDVPALDMTTISAGGGSIAWIDGGGFLNVGPQSAGADPGPACYGRGGTRPTVTDADLVCGYLNPGLFPRRRADARRRGVARGAGGARRRAAARWTCSAAAAGIQRIVDMRMADEVRVFAAKRGVDLSAFTLLPFGGAGAVHAAAVAEELGMRRILVPPRPGAFSALGLLCTDVVHDYIRSELRPLAEVDADHAEDDLPRSSRRKARDELAAEGMDAADARFARELDLRYTGQGYELRTPLDGLFARAADRGVARRRARAVRRAPRADPRPRRQGAAGRSGELSPARARRGAEIPAARGAAAGVAAPAADAVKGKRSVSFRRQRRRRGDALRARPARRRRDHRGPGHRRAVRRHHRHPAGLDRRASTATAT